MLAYDARARAGVSVAGELNTLVHLWKEGSLDHDEFTAAKLACLARHAPPRRRHLPQALPREHCRRWRPCDDTHLDWCVSHDWWEGEGEWRGYSSPPRYRDWTSPPHGGGGPRSDSGSSFNSVSRCYRPRNVQSPRRGRRPVLPEHRPPKRGPQRPEDSEPRRQRWTLAVDPSEFGRLVGREGERLAKLQQDHGVRVHVPRKGQSGGSQVWIEGRQGGCAAAHRAVAALLERSVSVVGTAGAVVGDSKYTAKPRLWLRLGAAPPGYELASAEQFRFLDEALSRFDGFVALLPSLSPSEPFEWLRHGCARALFTSAKTACAARVALQQGASPMVSEADFAPSALLSKEVPQRTLRIELAPVLTEHSPTALLRSLQELEGFEELSSCKYDCEDLIGRKYGRAFATFGTTEQARAARDALMHGHVSAGIVAGVMFPESAAEADRKHRRRRRTR
eukprot:TRINITY_DN15686_c1_g1_i1.p1 TRINITY_DN15686_c1_g1~~TRINITY_DN15686_c1_g1_i1.p1  ORF type:complete len:450 (+),score=63.53 TRINITY_DN15686_c1_g1_i1:50-1399(+)